MIFPVGTIVCAACIVVGGLIGTMLGDRVKEDTKDMLSSISGLCSMLIGIATVPGLANLPIVALSLILGTLIGRLLRLGDGITNGLKKATKGAVSDDLITIAVLFCVSGSGYYGAIIEGVNGDHSILLTKAVLDIFTSMIFACRMRGIVALLGIPQGLIHLVLFFVARWIYPLCNMGMIADFRAVGGILTMAAGFRILHLTMFPTADMIPALVVVMPLSYLWMTYILPILS